MWVTPHFLLSAVNAISKAEEAHNRFAQAHLGEKGLVNTEFIARVQEIKEGV